MFEASAQITGKLKLELLTSKKEMELKLKYLVEPLLEFELSIRQKRFQFKPDEWVSCCLGCSMGLWLRCFLAWVMLL